MAYKIFEGLSQGADSGHSPVTLHIDGQRVELPDASFVRDADMTRDGMDLVLQGPHGSVTVENYFASESAPDLVAPDGSTLTPDLVHSFVRSDAQFASAGAVSDESPIGAVQEVTGEAMVRHVDGTSEPIAVGTKIYLGDIIETDDHGAVNIMFNDETSFAVSEDARLAIDEYVYDPSTQSGETNFSVLKGVFVFTSGLIGRDDPDDVHIDTPVGSIGIRGTIIAGNVDTGEITVVEGAIVLHDHAGHEMTLASQFETAKFEQNGEGITHMGQLSADEMGDKFTVISDVAPTLFSSINDAAVEQGGTVQDEIQLDVPVDAAPEAAPATEGEALPGEAPAETLPGDANAAPLPGEPETVKAGDAPLDGQPNVLPPPPPPVVPMENNFGTNTSGFNSTTILGQPSLPPPPPTSALPPPPTSALPPPPPPVVNPTAPDNPPPVTGNEAAPPFTTTVTTFAFAEDLASNAVVATVTGVNGVIASIANITLSGFLANHFEVIAAGANTFDVRLKAGHSLDYDFLGMHGIANALVMNATSSTGQNSGGVINLQLLNADEGPIYQPHLIDTAPGGAINNPYLASSETGTWNYHFDKEFLNPDYNDPLTFQLSTATIAALNAWTNDGAGPNFDILVQGTGTGIGGVDAGHGWSFNQATGQLELFFNASFGFTPGLSQALTIQVQATDGTNVSGYHDYAFLAFNDSGTTLPGLLMVGTPGTVYVDRNDGTPDTSLTIGAGGAVTGRTVFMLNGNDTVTLDESTGNTINLGDGNNLLYINGAVANNGNTIIGGNDLDTFNIRNANNKIYGMDGDDDFVLYLGDGVGTYLQTNAGLGTLRFDGGWNQFRAADRLNDGDLMGVNAPGMGGNGGHGDSIVLNGAGNIDFTAIDNNYFKDFERLTAVNNLTNGITLSYTDVLQMTNGNHTLIINLDTYDTLNFLTEGHNFSKIGDDVQIDDARQGSGPDMQNYDIYTDGTVTLLVNDPGVNSVTGGLPV